jgi:hypothetical protein
MSNETIEQYIVYMEYNSKGTGDNYNEPNPREIIGCFNNIDEAKNLIAYINGQTLYDKLSYSTYTVYLDVINTPFECINIPYKEGYINLELYVLSFRVEDYKIKKSNVSILEANVPSNFQYLIKPNKGIYPFVIIARNKSIAEKLLEELEDKYLLDKDFNRLKDLIDYLYNFRKDGI